MQPSVRLILSAGIVCALLAPPAARAEAKAIASVETNMKSTAELYECRRKQGVLTVKVRFKAGAAATLDLPYAETYVVDTASGKKYTVLRDSDKSVIATLKPGWSEKIHESVKAGETFAAWWKFPAPPASTKQVTVMLPDCEPFEDVPITDAP